MNTMVLKLVSFFSLFQKKNGFAPMEYVINTRMSVSEIAYEVGYSSNSSLINQFVKCIGISPNQYRKTH